MTNLKTTKRALISSVVALFICFTMLLGTTFAWFTDSAVSSGNKIVAGKLDVELYQWTDANTSVNISASGDPVFTDDILWEPNMTEVVYLSIKNEGNLALKYKVAIEVTDVSEDSLLDVMEYAITPDAHFGDVTAWAGNGTKVVAGANATTAVDVQLLPDEEHFFALSVHMDEEAGNKYMNESVAFDIKVLAGQLAYEEDSFDNTYDEPATYPVVSAPVAISTTTTEAVEVATTGEDAVAISIPAEVAVALADSGVTEVALNHSEPKVDTVNNTVTFDSVDLVDQDGKIIDLSDNTVDLTVTLPAMGIADGTVVEIYHDGESVAFATVANENITYTVAHLCKINVYTSKSVKTAEELTEALANGQDVVFANDIETEAATTAPYGNKYAFALNGSTLDGNNKELYMECYGDDYGIMTTGGTIKNVTIKEGCRAIMIMYPETDVIVDNVNIGGDGVLYPINTGEAGADGVNLIVTNSTLAGWTSYGLIESASFTNVKFEQGTYYNNIYGRVLKPYVNTTLTDCSFIEHMNLDLSSLAEGHKITMTNCKVNGQAVTADVFTVPTTDAQYDEDLFTVDLPSWASSVTDCIIFVD